ncbi:MAG: hypothetical protein V3V96_10610 [Acidiferrobacterales bacterium]
MQNESEKRVVPVLHLVGFTVMSGSYIWFMLVDSLRATTVPMVVFAAGFLLSLSTVLGWLAQRTPQKPEDE